MGNIRHFRELDVYKMAMEAAETQVWLEMAVRCGYLDQATSVTLEQKYENILGKLVNMISHPDQWTIHSIREEEANYG